NDRRDRFGWLLSQRGHHPDAPGPGVSRPPYRWPRLAVSAGRGAQRRVAGAGVVPRAGGGDRCRRGERRSRRAHRALAALPPAGPLCAAPPATGVHRPEAALVPVAPEERRRQVRFRPHVRPGVRPVALGVILGAGEGSHLLQAPRVRARTDRARRDRLSARQRATAAGVVGEADDAPRARDASAGRLTTTCDPSKPFSARTTAYHSWFASGRRSCARYSPSSRRSPWCSRSTWCTSSAVTTPATTARRPRWSAP